MMSVYSKQLAIVIGGGAICIVAALAWYKYVEGNNTFELFSLSRLNIDGSTTCKAKRNSQWIIPVEWQEVGVVGDLWLYPLKSGRAIKVDRAECTPTGLAVSEDGKLTLRDREMLVYRESDNEQRSAKNYPQLVLIRVTSMNEEEIEFEAPNVSSLRIKIPKNVEAAPCYLCDREATRCIDLGDEAAKWISQYCLKKDQGLRIGYNANHKRNKKSSPWTILSTYYKAIRNEDMGIYADLMSYMLFNQASVDDLKKNIPDVVSALNFRPNIVVRGPEPYAEDHWIWIKVGDDVIFRNVKPCTRCRVVNVDPETAVPVPEQRIFRKLQEYRLVTDPKQKKIEGNSPVLGAYAGVYKLGHVKVGDKVYVGK